MAVVHLSPEIPRSSYRRRQSSQQSRMSDQSNLLSVSLSSQDIQDDDSPGSLSRSFSISLNRPRSASANATAAGNGKRKSLRLNRSRAASARMGNKARPGADGKSPVLEETATLQVDSAFHRIREQLAQLASEDQVLKQRVEKLNSEITALITHTVVRRKKGPRPHVRTASQGEITLTSPSWSPKHFSEYHTRKGRPIPILLVSGSQDSIKITPEMFSGSGSNSFQSEFLKGFAEQCAATENTPAGSRATQKEAIKKQHMDSLLTKTELMEVDHQSSLSQFVSNHARLETPT